jgi:hypothetical protein
VGRGRLTRRCGRRAPSRLGGRLRKDVKFEGVTHKLFEKAQDRWTKQSSPGFRQEHGLYTASFWIGVRGRKPGFETGLTHGVSLLAPRKPCPAVVNSRKSQGKMS